MDRLRRLVVEAGEAALKSRSTMRAEMKPDNTVVTNVDREIEEFLWSELSRLCPEYGFTGEEYGRRGNLDAPSWVCDPIDGTTNFVHGLPHWGVSVALVRDGVSELGVFYLPVLDELFWAVRGEGAFRNGSRMSAADGETFSPEDTLCFSSESMKSLQLSSLTGSLRGLGSIAAEMAYTAEGRFRAAFGRNPGAVDVAAAACICAEAGCELRWLNGQLVSMAELLEQPKRSGIFACAPPRTMSLLLSILYQG